MYDDKDKSELCRLDKHFNDHLRQMQLLFFKPSSATNLICNCQVQRSGGIFPQQSDKQYFLTQRLHLDLYIISADDGSSSLPNTFSDSELGTLHKA